MTEVIEQYGGTVDELIGDGILALFGAFESQGNDSEQAVACAVAMRRSLHSVNENNHRRDLPSIEMGIGISTGDVVVGNVGSERRSKFTAIGSAVNLAARIEGFANGGEILISPATYEDVSELVETDMVRELQAKGFAGTISARSVTAMREGQGI
jgi:adenylate cyclase